MATEQYYGTGRRKSSVARVRLQPGTGKLSINNRTRDVYVTEEAGRMAVEAPLLATDSRHWPPTNAYEPGRRVTIASSSRSCGFMPPTIRRRHASPCWVSFIMSNAPCSRSTNCASAMSQP